MNLGAKLLAAALFFAGFATYASADTTWTLDATFTYDGMTNTATGTFTVNSGLSAITSWDITVTGTNTPADDTYTSAPPDIVEFPDTTHVDFYDANTNQYIDLYLASPLSNAGGTINLLAGDNGETTNSTIVCGSDCGVLDEGTLSAAPEPLSLLLFGTGLVAIMGMVRRKVSNSKQQPRV